MIAEYRRLSSGYFDLVVTDECHRSISGKWSATLRHFDGIQLGLTATPCTADTDVLPDPEDGLFRPSWSVSTCWIPVSTVRKW
ncbi:Type I restriction-modification system,restriction subunit R (EC 3.1.21.3) [Candidatus Synechococcus spongiarum]|uniref:Type I restriction-modification system,restriction subunit R n=2 Tax=Candidatus Synechococcus spongiarum TaxID=431041 RepID=A0A161KA31_9SYNE|nr:Type I restriction-modification system,restriction subunit R (EC 3.1.21.3) [Candidatus Synechococcus spongiarum]